jgi:transposase
LAQRFDDPALQATYGHYRATLQARDAALDAIEADLASWYPRPPFADAVARLAAYRGVTRLGALPLASEVGDWRRFASAPQFMGFCGLTPSEYSSGQRTWRGQITKTGDSHLRAQLVESAWAYQYRPRPGGCARPHSGIAGGLAAPPPDQVHTGGLACGQRRRMVMLAWVSGGSPGSGGCT